MLRTGLVSVTFREKSVMQIIRLVKKAGLDAIEWGGDIHVPHGDFEQAAKVREMTLDAGLEIAAYGSYYRVAQKNEVPFDDVLQTAVELGAPTVRVWAGARGSSEIKPVQRFAVITESRVLAEKGEDAGVKVAFEFHKNTLTDTTESTAKLLEDVNHPNIWTYWQPPIGWDFENCCTSLESLFSYVLNIHVYSWNDEGKRLPLKSKRDVWKEFFTLINKRDGEQVHHAMLEFVKNDDSKQFIADASVLKAIIDEVQPNHDG